MDRFGANVNTRREEGEGICREIYLTYHCGCEYSSGCLDRGEGFESYCDEHQDEATSLQLKMDALINERDALIKEKEDHRISDDDAKIKDANHRIAVYELARERSQFKNRIMGR